MITELLTPFDLQSRMLAKSDEIDTAVAEQRMRGVALVEATRTARVAVNSSLAASEGKSADVRKAKAELASEDLIYKEDMARALEKSALEALRAKREQLQALVALGYTIRTEMQLAR